METFVSITWSGIWLGTEYAAIAVALVVHYLVTRVVNVTTGQLFVFCALMAAWLEDRGAGPAVALVAVAAAGAALSGLMDYGLLQKLKQPTPGRLILMTVGAAVVLMGLSIVWFGRDPLSGQGLVDGAPHLGVWEPSWDQLVFVTGMVAASAAVAWLVSWSATGKAISAAGHDPGAAAMLGVNVAALRVLATAVAGALLGLAGVLFLPLGVLDFSIGLRLTLFGFVAAALSGYRSVPAAVGMGWLVGVIDALATSYISSESGLMITFLVLIAIALGVQWVRSERAAFDTV